MKKIIADVGGTHARFAVLNEDNVIQDHCVLKTDDYAYFIDAYNAYLQHLDNPIILHAAIAIANPVSGDLIKMTNHNWTFSIEEVRQSLQLETLIFKNDFTALALSIPYLESSEFYQVGGNISLPEYPIGVLGPGTGLGVSGLVYSNGQWTALAGEGGHVSLSPTTDREQQILDVCWKRYPHVSAERLVSGSGLQTILQALHEIEGVSPKVIPSPNVITSQAIAQTDRYCREAVDIFCGLLGTVAGNLALTLGAKGGVYIGGGIIPKLGIYFESSPFRHQFEAKGRFNDYLKDIPVFVIQSKYAALTGISQVFSR